MDMVRGGPKGYRRGTKGVWDTENNEDGLIGKIRYEIGLVIMPFVSFWQ